MTKLVALLSAHSGVEVLGDRTSIATRRAVLSCLSKVLVDEKMKELAIKCKVVDAVEPLLSRVATFSNPSMALAGDNKEAVKFFQSEDGETERRLAAATLMAIAVAENGKSAVIAKPDLIEITCQLVMGNDTRLELRRNASEILRLVPTCLHC